MQSTCACVQGQALNEVASQDCKVLVVGNPCNTNTLICMENAPRLQRRNFHALTRLDENRAKCQLALKAQRPYTCVSNLCVWGNHSTTQVASFPSPTSHSIQGLPSAQPACKSCLFQSCCHWRSQFQSGTCHSWTVHAQVPDFLNACIAGEPAMDVVRNDEWFRHEFTPTVAGRGERHSISRQPSDAFSC